MSTPAVDGYDAIAGARIFWVPLGDLRLDEDANLMFPSVAAVPGIYRFLIDDGGRIVAWYVGQAKKSLATRFALYRSRAKKPSLPLDKKTTSRIASRLLRELGTGHTVRVGLLDDRALYPDGQVKPLDLADNTIRSKLERRLISELYQSGIEVLNRDWNPHWKQAANSWLRRRRRRHGVESPGWWGHSPVRGAHDLRWTGSSRFMEC
jgi:hypothetical protein